MGLCELGLRELGQHLLGQLEEATNDAHYLAFTPMSPRWRRTSILLLLLTSLLTPLVQPTAARSEDKRAHPQLLREAAANPDTTFRVTIQRLNGNRAVDNDTVKEGGNKVRDMKMDAFVANLPGNAIGRCNTVARAGCRLGRCCGSGSLC